MKKKNLAFTLAEVLIVIGIIGVVAALTLPNLNHATGDKETVTRLQKAYSILNEANDRAVAIYGPISTWKSNEQCADDIGTCWMNRIKEFLKVSKTCYTSDENCDSYIKADDNNFYDGCQNIFFELSDGILIAACNGGNENCDEESAGQKDICADSVWIDVNNRKNGKNRNAHDVFAFKISDSIGIMPFREDSVESTIDNCLRWQQETCTYWVIEYGNLDYLKIDPNTHKCNYSNIILDGVTNTSCH